MPTEPKNSGFTEAVIKQVVHESNLDQLSTYTKGDFIQYLQEHPNERFWQALCLWSGALRIELDGEDTFYLIGKNFTK